MREHMGMFRGKCLGNRQWVQGSLIISHYDVAGNQEERCEIQDMNYGIDDRGFFDCMSGISEMVDPTTVGECTGLKDRNGTLIFEGDIIQSCNGEIYQVKWFEKYAKFAVWKPGIVLGGIAMNRAEVIGNIHDNPELIGGTS